jgi:hypothetical protein
MLRGGDLQLINEASRKGLLCRLVLKSAMGLVGLVASVACFAIPAAAQQVSIWPSSAVPATVNSADSNAVEVGVKFRSDVGGFITGIRFYKGSQNTGTHVGHLWSQSGTLLGTVTFSNETTSGWQQANFSSPVQIQANTTYVASYYCPRGYYSSNGYFFSSSGVDSAPLHALRDNADGANGVYAYGQSGFPNQSWHASNYWVDVAFTPSSQSTGGGGVPAASGSTSSIWSANAVPGNAAESDSSAVEVGVKFQSDAAGTITGIRFFKSTQNTGTHVGHLWSSNGSLLGTVTFSNESASGWQQASFSQPIAIQAKTTYVASYYAPRGYYADDEYAFNSAVNSVPLHALQDGASGPNGVYTYGTGFPNQGWHASNYWVDVLFSASSGSGGSGSGGSTPPPPPSTYAISGKVSGSAATLTLSGAGAGTAQTDSSGNYSFSGLANGSYVVAPSQSGYSFSPSTASVSVNGGNVAGVNFTGSTTAPAQHSVTLHWTASTSGNITGYKVYRATASGGPYSSVTSVTGTSYVDNSVTGGQTYYYVLTAVDSNDAESGYSTEATAAVPAP